MRVVFYDKIKDLKRAKISIKRAEDKDSVIQLGLAIEKKGPFELLRMEVRLNNRQKIRQVLGKINTEVEPTFASLFSQEIAKKVLLWHLDEIESNYPALLAYQADVPDDFIIQILTNNPKMKLGKALKMLGLKSVLDKVNTRGFREITQKFGSHSWYSLNKEMKGLKAPSQAEEVFSVLQSAVQKFEPLKLADFQDEVYNNVN